MHLASSLMHIQIEEKFSTMYSKTARKISILSLFVFFVNISWAQDEAFARKVIDTLAAPGMHGRGYVNDGEKIAAEYIAHQFNQLGLESYYRDYFQKFEFPINTFPGKMDVAINGKILIAGEDYLVLPASPGCDFNGEVVYLNKEQLLDSRKLLYRANEFEKAALVADLGGFVAPAEKKQAIENINQAANTLKDHPVIWLTDEKLTWSLAGYTSKAPVIQIKKSSLGQMIQNVTIDIESKYHEQYKTQNIVGLLEGKQKDSVIVLTAHYDHLGRMGSDTYFPGANDNASGIAMLLNLAKHFTKAKQKPEFTIVFIAFGAEEAGLIGSRYFVKNPPFSLAKIKFLINLDLAGTGDDGITVVNATKFPDRFYQLENLNRQYTLLTRIKKRGEACNSDHCFFYMAGVPCFYIYTLGGITAYHDIDDKAASLPLTEYRDYFTLLSKFIEHLM